MKARDFAKVLQELNLHAFPRMIGTPNTIPRQSPVMTMRHLLGFVKTENYHDSLYISQNPFGFTGLTLDKIYADNIFIDTDSNELEESWKETLKMHEFYLDENLPFNVLYTANRGYHISIPLESSEYDIDDNEVWRYYRGWFGFIEDKLELKTVDSWCAEPRRLRRVPITVHPKTKRWCIPLTEAQLFDMEGTIEASKKPVITPGKYHIDGKLRLNIKELMEHFDVDLAKYENPEMVDFSEFNIPKTEFADYLNLIIPDKCVVNEIFNENPCHIVRFTFCAWLKYLEFTEEQAKGMMDKLAVDWKDGHITSERYKQINHIYKRNYRITSCRKLVTTAKRQTGRNICTTGELEKCRKGEVDG